MTSQEMSDGELFQRYVEICNQALEANKGRFPFKQILRAAQDHIKHHSVAVHMVDDCPVCQFHIALKGQKVDLTTFSVKPSEPSAEWYVSKSYLLNVVAHPDQYIQNPAKIDWEWMIDRR